MRKFKAGGSDKAAKVGVNHRALCHFNGRSASTEKKREPGGALLVGGTYRLGSYFLRCDGILAKTAIKMVLGQSTPASFDSSIMTTAFRTGPDPDVDGSRPFALAFKEARRVLIGAFLFIGRPNEVLNIALFHWSKIPPNPEVCP
jgi:hypothetical protein